MERCSILVSDEKIIHFVFFYQNAVSVNINKCENQRNTVIFNNPVGTECRVMHRNDL